MRQAQSTGWPFALETVPSNAWQRIPRVHAKTVNWFHARLAFIQRSEDLVFMRMSPTLEVSPPYNKCPALFLTQHLLGCGDSTSIMSIAPSSSSITRCHVFLTLCTCCVSWPEYAGPKDKRGRYFQPFCNFQLETFEILGMLLLSTLPHELSKLNGCALPRTEARPSASQSTSIHETS